MSATEPQRRRPTSLTLTAKLKHKQRLQPKRINSCLLVLFVCWQAFDRINRDCCCLFRKYFANLKHSHEGNRDIMFPVTLTIDIIRDWRWTRFCLYLLNKLCQNEITEILHCGISVQLLPLGGCQSWGFWVVSGHSWMATRCVHAECDIKFSTYISRVPCAWGFYSICTWAIYHISSHPDVDKKFYQVHLPSNRFNSFSLWIWAYATISFTYLLIHG